MDKESDHKTERILKITLEIIYLLTGEDYTVVKKISGEPITYSSCQQESGKIKTTKNPITVPQLRLHINDQKILELTNKIIHLLTGEELEYIEEHNDLCKKVKIENNELPLDGSGYSPEVCPQSLYSQDCPEKNHNIPEECQAADLSDITVQVIEEDEEEDEDGGYMMQDLQSKDEKIPIDLSTDCKKEDKIMAHGSHGRKKHRGSARASNPSNNENCSNNLDTVTRRLAQRGSVLPCSECGKCAPRNSKCPSHNVTHTGEKPFPCSECGKSFSQKSELLKHQRLHTGEKPFSCFECGKCFQKESHLVMHLKIHTDMKPFPCFECGKCFTKESDFVSHQLIHTREAEFPSSSLEKGVAHKAILTQQHARSGEKVFPCSECERCFTQKCDLVKHQRIHTGERPYKCSECTKSFTKTSDYVRHQWSHTGERPFQCSACGKCFAYKTVLINHQRIHTGEKPFSCSECGKSFRQKTHLMTHRRIHTSEKPFQCSECGDCFTYKLALVKHQRQHKI